MMDEMKDILENQRSSMQYQFKQLKDQREVETEKRHI
jgi:predicted transcriptional regulator